MAGLLFGTAGVPRSTKEKTSVGGIKRIAELGLGCMELEFVRGVKMGEASARLVAQAAAAHNIKLTAHAPYFINLNAHEPEKIRASQDHIVQTARIAQLCGAESIIFHPASYMGEPPEQVYETVKQNLAEVLNWLERENNTVWIRPEVMGKAGQFGTIEEILRLSVELGGKLAPGIDFAHWHARTGAYNTYREFMSVLEQVRDKLGRSTLDHMHMHVSGIKYGKRGELAHLNFKESDFRYDELLRALEDCGASGMVICESPNLEGDALLLRDTYNKL
jgi:deoxyribonuclease-4